MALTAGTRLGPYEIVAAIGAGGMGEVYRARDVKLNRDVAIKALSDAFIDDADRIARFGREAQALAALNHPHIGAIYGLEEALGSQFLILELVEGDTLADRLQSGAFAIDEVVAVARQMADALEAAHERGIVHRDLKPANVKITPEGTVKVLDFGLAKAIDSTPSAANLTRSPTLTAPLGTMAGIILGTAAYMAPEQARGRAVDKRADIWAFGVVCYEMLTGRRPFDPSRGSGASRADSADDANDLSMTLAFVMTKEPDWTALPTATPLALRTVLRRCLEKDPRKRLRDIGEARLQLSESLVEVPPESVAAPAPLAPVVQAWRRALPWVMAGALAVALALVLGFMVPWRASTPSPKRLSADLGADLSLVNPSQGASIALSRDGRTIVFAGSRRQAGATAQLFVRRLDQLQATPLPGTEGAQGPVFSPDGQWVGFFAAGKLKKVAIVGGAVITLCDAPSPRGASWADDGTIVFQSNSAGGAALQRVASAGGKPEPLLLPAEGAVTQRWPQMLPGGKAVIYTTSSTTNFESGAVVVASLPSGPSRILLSGGSYGRYLASGHVVYIHDGTMFAVPFDVKSLAVTGTPVPIVEGVSGSAVTGVAHFAVADDGTLAYVRGDQSSFAAPMLWLDRTGTTTPMRAMRADWSNPFFAPDGRRIAFDILDNTQSDIWVYDWARDTPSRLTFDASADDFRPVWSPGNRIVFSSTRDKTPGNLYWQRADGTGEVVRLTTSKNLQTAGAWHPSGKVLAFTETTQTAGNDLMLLSIKGDDASGWKVGTPKPFLSTPAGEAAPAFSPDGRWIAYQSTESGGNEICVRPFPGPGGKWQVSTAGGTQPNWSRAGNELYYLGPDNQIMVASYALDGTSFRADKPRVWSETRLGNRRAYKFYDLHPDGKRFVMNVAPSIVTNDKVVFVFNFFDELRRIASVRPQ